MSIQNKSTSAFLWNAGQIFIAKFLSILVTLILANLLVPDDFGLIAIITVFMMFSGTLIAAGLKEALIRLPRIRNIHLNTVFYTNLFIGTAIYLLIFLFSPFVADFYGKPILVELIRVTSIVIFFTSVNIIQEINLTRKLDFKSLFKIAIPANIISGIIAVILAYLDFGVWALVAQTVVSPLIFTILYWKKSDWRPKMQFSFLILKSLFSFSYKLLLASLIGIVITNSYSLVIAKIFTTQILGLYFMANKVKDIVLNIIVSGIENVFFPALSQIQTDKIRLLKAQRQILQIISFILFPSMIMLATFSDLIFKVLFDSEWSKSAEYLKYFCIAALFYPVERLNLVMFKVLGMANELLFTEVLKNIIIIITLTISVNFGIKEVLIGLIIVSVVTAILFALIAGKHSGYTLMAQMKDMLPMLLVALLASSFAFFITEQIALPGILNLATAIILSLLTYILIALKFKFYAAEFILDNLTKKLKSKS